MGKKSQIRKQGLTYYTESTHVYTKGSLMECKVKESRETYYLTEMQYNLEAICALRPTNTDLQGHVASIIPEGHSMTVKVRNHYKTTEARGFDWLNLKLYSVVEDGEFHQVSKLATFLEPKNIFDI